MRETKSLNFSDPLQSGNACSRTGASSDRSIPRRRSRSDGSRTITSPRRYRTAAICLHGFDQSGQLHQKRSRPSVGYRGTSSKAKSSSIEVGISPARMRPTPIAPIRSQISGSEHPFNDSNGAKSSFTMYGSGLAPSTTASTCVPETERDDTCPCSAYTLPRPARAPIRISSMPFSQPLAHHAPRGTALRSCARNPFALRGIRGSYLFLLIGKPKKDRRKACLLHL